MKFFDDQSIELSLDNIVNKIRLKESNGFEWRLNPIEIQCCLGLTPTLTERGAPWRAQEGLSWLQVQAHQA